MMTRSMTKNILLLSAAIVALGACSSDKGPGAIGTKNDIIVRNKGIPGAETQTADVAQSAQPGDFSTSVEQAEAVPAPAVESAESLSPSSPAIDAAAQEIAEAQAPVPATTNAPMDEAVNTSPAASAIATQASPADQAIPVETVPAASTMPPLQDQVTSAPVQQVQPSSVYPAEDYAQAAPVQQAAMADPSVAAPVASPPAIEAPEVSPHAYVPAPRGYEPSNPNAPYSPRDAAAYAATAGGGTAPASPDVAGAPLNLTDIVVIRSAQAALKAKGGYTGIEDGKVNADFLNALSLYQGQNKLPQGGLNHDTLRSLGVIE